MKDREAVEFSMSEGIAKLSSANPEMAEGSDTMEIQYDRTRHKDRIQFAIFDGFFVGDQRRRCGFGIEQGKYGSSDETERHRSIRLSVCFDADEVVTEIWNCEKFSIPTFRNLEEVDLVPGPGMNVIYGENAQGKTNLAGSSIFVLSTLRSFRTRNLPEALRFGEAASIAGRKCCYGPGKHHAGSVFGAALKSMPCWIVRKWIRSDIWAF